LLASQGYESPLWLTFKQANEFGGTVRKGEKATPVVFWLWPDEEAKAKARAMGREAVPVCRYYSVFNVAQCDGLPEVKTALVEDSRTVPERISEAEGLVAGITAPPRYVAADDAWYSPVDDKLGMPSLERFETAERYYATLFHELTHATGHESRLGRFKPDAAPSFFGGESYAKEELVAEMGAAMLCGVVGIANRTIDQSASYIASWLKALKNDKTMVISAAAQAQKAADWLRGETAAAKAEE